jgi:REP element-mobilizing transposase RayT
VTKVARKRIRLPGKAYADLGRVFSITIGTSPRRAIFRDLEFGLECVNLLRELRDNAGLRVYAYCLMPDHVHLLIAVPANGSLSAVVGSWKSRCYQVRRKSGDHRRFWQRSFFDHGLRDNQDIVDVAMYVVGNPVRAGIAKDFREYPLSGSFEFEL